MPIHRGTRLNDLIARLPSAIPAQASIYKTWPNLAAGIGIAAGADPAAWTEFISAASAPAQPFTVSHIYLSSSIGNCTGIEIGTGAAGSEVVVGFCPFIAYNSSYNLVTVPVLPVIPGGTRVALRTYSGNSGASTQTAGVLICKLPTRLDVLNTMRWVRKMASAYPGPSTLVSQTVDTKNPQTNWGYTGTWSTLYPNNVESNPVVLTSLTFASNYLGIAKFGWGATPTIFGEFFADQSGTNNIYSNSLDLPVPLILPGSTAVQWDAQIATANGTVYYPRFGMYRLPQMGVW